MDEYAIGEVAVASDGRLYRFRGGEASDRANWEPVSVSPDDQTPEETATEAALIRTNERGGNGFTDFLAQARHALTFGFDDEIAGALAGDKAKQDIRQAVADRRLLNPGASAVSEIAGGLPAAMVPLGAGVSAVRGGAGLLGGATRGAIAGGLEGGLLGVGEAEGPLASRARSALPEAAIGAGLGATAASLPVVANAVLRKGARRGERVGAELAEKAGLSTDFEGMTAAAETARRDASEKLFGPIDKMGKINNAKITAVLQESGVPAADKPRTLKELQTLHARLKRTNEVAAGELKDVMEAEIPGLADANRAYGPAARPFEALEAGRASYRTSADIRKAMEGMGADEAKNFRSARLHDILAKLEKRDESAVGLLREYMDAGPETRAQIRTLFADDDNYKQFMRILQKEKSAEKVGSFIAGKAPWGIGGGLVGAGIVAGTRSLLN